MKFDWMLTILAIGAVLVALSFWRAHRRPGFDFNAFDLIMENGRVSKIALTFMLAFAVTTWILIDLQLKGKMTEGYLTVYGGMWVASLVAKVVFNKSEMPSGTTVTSVTSTMESTEKVVS
jgi:hypothetical protein